MKSFNQLLIILIAVLTLVFGACTNCQETKKISGFTIQIQKTETGIQLKCSEGCAWKALTFSVNNHQPQIVDELGMKASKERQTAKADPKFADFSFSIVKTETDIELKGLEGTAWTELHFSLVNDQTQMIDHKGMKE